MTDQPTLPGIDLSLDAMVEDAVKLLRQCQPQGQPYYGSFSGGKDYSGYSTSICPDYYGCFSGGKDSCVIKELARMAGVNVVWHYNVTTIDPPELVQFIKREHPDVVFERPEMNFFTFAVKQKYGFPTRRVRWCCEVYKEQRSPKGARMIMGVRAAESARRSKNWREVTFHRRTRESVICPIVRWSDAAVWSFIRSRGLAYCCLYDEGFDRLGCIGCPMARKAGRLKEFARWPGFERKWKELFKAVWDMRTGTAQRNGRQWFGDRYFANWEEMWEWWLSDEPLPKDEEDKCQGLLEFFS